MTLADIAREGTSVPPEDAVLAGKAVAIGLIFFLVGITAGLMKWHEVQFTLYIVGLCSMLFGAAVYWGFL